MSTASSPAARKPIGVRATPEQHELLVEAAQREQRSVSSFVLQAALRAAQGEQQPQRSREEVFRAIDRAQATMRELVPRKRSLVKEWLKEKRAASDRE